MKRFKVIFTILTIGGMLVTAAACGSSKAADATEQENLQLTVEGIYADQTAQVMEAQAAEPLMEAEPAEEMAEPVVEEQPAEESPAETPKLSPGEIPDPYRTLEDADSSLRATEHRVLSGDTYLNNLYERPFTAYDMDYQPELDIYTVDFAYDDSFFYFTLTLKGMKLESGAMYGVEFDRRLKGRGDLLVLAVDPGDEWSMDNMIIWEDKNGSVGGLKPTVAEKGFNGNGYDQQVDLGEDRLAFSRLSPENPRAVEIAISRALLNNPEEFMWSAWADNGLQDVSMFDYNDAIGLTEAGSPFKNDDDYPIKALYSVDNTCRLPYQVEMPELIPGACKSIAPPSAPSGKTTITCPPGCWVIGDHCECIE